ncbi:MAG: PucR family transcriptional regulator ligand-binding domain-containing protein, partial [Chloroflexota bacterium]|nr:PucR family transcriptional regulator ligand-binding domain-containing protein [Chloroflexota bacterium]
MTVRSLLHGGQPLEGAVALAGETRLDESVSWAISLRPYPPAFPKLRGGELALVAAEHLARLDPPATLTSVVQYLASKSASGIAVRGRVEHSAIEAAREAHLPLLRLPDSAQLHDIEQAVIRECALHLARKEVQPVERPGAWIEELLEGRIGSEEEATERTARHGITLLSSYSVAFVVSSEQAVLVHLAVETLRPAPITHSVPGGLALFVPPQSEEGLFSILRQAQTPSGLGSERSVLQANISLEEARAAATVSERLRNCAPTRYAELGADKLLVLMLKKQPDELKRFAIDTVG